MKEKDYKYISIKTAFIMILFFSFVCFLPSDVSALSCRLTKKYDEEKLSEEDLEELASHDASEEYGNYCKYEDFDWDKFYYDQKRFWGSNCEGFKLGTEEYEKCESPVLKEHKNFFTKMYQALANYQNNNGNPLVINDTVVLRTIFFEALPSELTENPDATDYEEFYRSTKLGNKYDSGASISPNDPFNSSEAKYYENEIDTLKIVIKNAVAYTSMCYRKYGVPFLEEQEDGTTTKKCLGTDIILLKNNTEICGKKEAKYMMGFWEYFSSKIRRFFTTLFPFLGKIWKNDAQDKCDAIGGMDELGEYTGVYEFNDDPEVNYAKYFEFLEANRFFDRKPHLQHYFEDEVLIPNGYDCMTLDVCDNALEKNQALYREVEEKCVEIRKKIVNNIKSILEMDGIYIDTEGYIYDPDAYGDGSLEPGSGLLGSSLSCGDNLVWPLGSMETTEEDGITYAMGTPASTKITSRFGPRNIELAGASTNHRGIDISHGGHGSGVVPVIAAADGVVVHTYTACKTDSNSKSSEASLNCGDRAGNFVTIEHSETGLITLYAHLAYNSITVQKGQQVKRGQVIGKLGSTGGSTGPHLHFGVKSGGDYVDPEKYVSPSNPRPECRDLTESGEGEGFGGNVSGGSSVLAEGELLRTGKYGSYYGNSKTSSQPLTQEQMNVNAVYIYKALSERGWTLNAIAGLLGNMQYESSINPGRWQSDSVGSTGSGYGLVQWTPATKYINTVSDDYSTMDNNIDRIMYELEHNEQYYKTGSYPLTFKEFTQSTKDAYYLACAFAWNYERSKVVLEGSASEKESLRNARGGAAQGWYEYLSSVNIDT